MFSNVNPQYPGLVGMLANSGSLDQAGIPFTKRFGDVADDGVFGAAALADCRRRRGARGCAASPTALIGGRSLGIDTTVIDPAQWMKQFGIDVDHVDQFELVRRAELELAGGNRVAAGARLLEEDRGADPLDGARCYVPAHRGAAPPPARDVLRRDRSDRGVQVRLLRHQGPARADRALRHRRRRRGVPQRSVRARRQRQAVDRLLDRGRLRRGADDADLQAPGGHAGAVRGRAALPRRSRRVGPVQQRRARDLLRRAAATTRRSTCRAPSSVRRASTSRPAARRCTTSRRRAA